MIDGILIGQFDLTQGCVVQLSYPKTLMYDESMFASYMIPDGAHQWDYEHSVFKCKMQQKTQDDIDRGKVFTVDMFFFDQLDIKQNSHDDSQLESGNWVKHKLSEKHELIFMKVSDNFKLEFFSDSGGQQKIFIVDLHQDFQLCKLQNNFYNFYTFEGDCVGIKLKKDNFSVEFDEGLGLVFQKNIQMSLQQGGFETESSQTPLNQLENLKTIPKDNNQIFNCFALIKNKRDSQIKRGLLTRSLGIVSEQINSLYIFQEILKFYIDIYIEMPINEDQIVLPKMYEIICSVFRKMNQMIETNTLGLDSIISTPNQFLFQNSYAEDLKKYSEQSPKLTSPTTQFINYRLTDEQTATINFPVNDGVSGLPRNYFCQQPSLSDFIQTFRDKTMILYNSILKQQKILFVGYQMSIKEAIKSVQICQQLVRPLNIQRNIHLYKHLHDLEFLQQESYIAIVTNPIFTSHKQWWDVCVDLTSGKITVNSKPDITTTSTFNNSNSNLLQDNRNKMFDLEFINEVMKGIFDQKLDEDSVRRAFYNYTNNFVDLVFGRSSLIDLQFEDEIIKQSFIRRIQIFVTSQIYKNLLTYFELEDARTREVLGNEAFDKLKKIFTKQIYANSELKQLYGVLSKEIQNDTTLKIVLDFIHREKQSFELLTLGFLSGDQDLVVLNTKLLNLIEKWPLGNSLLRSFNFFILYLYQNKDSILKSLV